MKVSRDSLPYNPSISTLEGKSIFVEELIDLLIGARKSQINASSLSVKVSKDSTLYNPSISTFYRKRFSSDQFVDLPKAVRKLQIKV